ncbi:MAG: adenylate/guanylate cyclase domain-containing protein [Alphaproteobacteria bacterium]
MINWKRNIKTEILLKTLFFICISVAGVIVPTYILGKKTAIENAKESIQKLNFSTIQQTAYYIKTTQSLMNNTLTLFQDHTFAYYDKDERLINYLFSILKTVENITSMTFVNEKGSFLSVVKLRGSKLSDKKLLIKKNIPENTWFALRFVNNDPQFPKNVTSYFDCDFKLIFSTTESYPVDDFRNFKWYKRALQEEKTTWSDIHLLHTVNKPGVTSSIAIKDNNKNLKGVLSVDLSLESLSEFLNETRASDNTRSFIVNKKGHIVADSDMPQTVVKDEKQLSILTIKDLEDKNLLKMLLIHQNMSKSSSSEYNFTAFTGENEKEYVTFITYFPGILQLDWKIVSLSPVYDFTESLVATQKNSIYIALIILIVSVVFIYFQTQKLSDPIVELKKEAEKITQLKLNERLVIKSNIYELKELTHSMQELKTTLSNFTKYLPKGLVKKLINTEKEIALGGSLHEITISFSDIESFTNVSEQMSPRQLMLHLSDYFERLSNIIIDNNGTIDKFIGDAIMSFWGAPESNTNQAYEACRSALLCQQKLDILNKYWKSMLKPPLRTRIDINKGYAVVGNVGSSERMNYTAIGDSVNLASRLEGVNKLYGTQTLISHSVKEELDSNFITRPIDIVAVKGKNQGVQIYELVGLKEDSRLIPVSKEQQTFCKLFEDAFNLYLSRHFKQAKEKFTNLEKKNEQEFMFKDFVIPIYIERCKIFIKSPPGKDWDGVVQLTSK